MKDPEVRAKMSESAKKRSRLNDKFIRNLSDYQSLFSRYKKGFYNSSKICDIHDNNYILYESLYELYYYVYLDNSNDIVKAIREPVGIKYTDSNGLDHLYYPDILVKYTNGIEELIEIKPKGGHDR